MTDDKVSTRVGEPTAEWLTDRATRMYTGSHHLQAKVELALWQGVLAAELRRVRLTLDEARCVADVLNSHMMDASLGSLAFAQCYDAFRLARETPLGNESSYGKKWNIDEQDLLNRLGELGPAADHALRDAISRWWKVDGEPTAEGFKAVGLRIIDTDKSEGATE